MKITRTGPPTYTIELSEAELLLMRKALSLELSYFWAPEDRKEELANLINIINTLIDAEVW